MTSQYRLSFRSFMILMALVYLFAFIGAQVAKGQTQQTLTLTGPPNARPGTTIVLNMSLAGSASTPPAGIQWTMTNPPGWVLTPSTGPASTSAGKTLTCGPTYICLVTGLNANTISPGVLGSYSAVIPTSAPPGGISLPLSGVLAGNAIGDPMTLLVGPTYSVTILAKSDLDGDGKTGNLDVQSMLDQAKGTASCANDQNGDGVCNLYDVLIVTNIALGQ